jgi:(2Fe-2S) ferredoxin
MSRILESKHQLLDLCAQQRAARSKKAEEGVTQIRICMGASCIAAGSRRVKQAMAHQLETQGLQPQAEICEVGCLGPCSGGPVVVVGDVFYEKVRPNDCAAIVRDHLSKGQIVEIAEDDEGGLVYMILTSWFPIILFVAFWIFLKKTGIKSWRST